MLAMNTHFKKSIVRLVSLFLLGLGIITCKSSMLEAAEHPNVSAKISGLNTAADWQSWTGADLVESIGFALEVFGPQRLMFGSDWPVAVLAGDYAKVWAETNKALDELGVRPDQAVMIGDWPTRDIRGAKDLGLHTVWARYGDKAPPYKDEALKAAGLDLNIVVEVLLDREIAKNRIMGRRLCANDNNHPNHIAFEAIKPVEKDGRLVCRVCGGELSMRDDDQDEEAIGKRHDIYYDDTTGTMAAVNYFKNKAGAEVISVDGSRGIKEISEEIMGRLA